MGRLAVRLAVLVSFLLSAPLVADTLPELYQTAKAQVKSHSWQEALTTLDQLDVESARPGNETLRQQLTAPIAFYRGVCEANLDQAGKAEADFATYLQAQPGAAIDKTTYSKKAVAAFEAASKIAAPNAAGTDAAPQGGSHSLVQRFGEFKAPPKTGESHFTGPSAHRSSISDGASVPGQWFMANRNSVHFDGFTATDASNGFREIWYYERETLPKTVSANELNVSFVTKIGYGRFVLLRQPPVLNALIAARAGAPGTGVAGGMRPQQQRG